MPVHTAGTFTQDRCLAFFWGRELATARNVVTHSLTTPLNGRRPAPNRSGNIYSRKGQSSTSWPTCYWASLLGSPLDRTHGTNWRLRCFLPVLHRSLCWYDCFAARSKF